MQSNATVRFIARVSPRVRGQRKQCAAATCPEPTSDGKPFCVAHLERSPYVRELLVTLRRRAAAKLSAVGRRLTPKRGTAA